MIYIFCISYFLISSIRCSECYSSSTHQRNTDILQLRTRTEVKRHDLKGETVNIQCEFKIELK